MKHIKVFFKTRNPIRELFPDKNKPLHFWQCTHRDTIERGGGSLSYLLLKRVSNSKNAKHKTNIETQMYFLMYLIFVRIELLWRLLMSFVIRNIFLLFIYTVFPLDRYGTRFFNNMLAHCTLYVNITWNAFVNDCLFNNVAK